MNAVGTTRMVLGTVAVLLVNLAFTHARGPLDYPTDDQQEAFATAGAHVDEADGYDAYATDGRGVYGAYYDAGDRPSSTDADRSPMGTVSHSTGAGDHVGPAASGCSPCRCGTCNTCKKQKALQKAAATAYKPLFYDNKFDYLNDASYNDWHLGESAKQRQCGDCWTFDFGGQYRLRYHNEHNLRRRPLSGASDDFLLHRTRLYTDAQYSDWFRFYGEAIDATSNGQRYTPRGIEVNRFDALNLFGDFKVWQQDGSQMWIRPGRQELLYGAQRVVSPLDWSNTRRTFDGAKAYWRGTRWNIDGWWTRPVSFGQHIAGGRQDHNFDHPNLDQDFIGLWAHYRTKKGRALEAYYLRLDNYAGLATNVNGNQGDFDYNMFGGRLLGEQLGLLYELWGGYQFGEWAGDDISAGMFTVGLGKKFGTVAWTPTLWAYYDWASGDHNLNDGKIATANQYFPLGHKYLGWMDIIGRQNIQDANVLLVTNPAEKVKFLIWYHAFFLQSRFDALYNAGGAPIYQDPTGQSGNQVGQELDLLIQWVWSPRTDIWFGYSHFFADNYFDSPTIQNGPAGLAANGANGHDADFFYTQFTINF